MKSFAIMILCALAGLPLYASGQKIVADEIPGVGIRTKGRVIIRGDGRTIHAYQIDGNLTRQLVRIRSTRRTYAPRPFGPEVYDSRAGAPKVVPEAIRLVIEEASKKHGVDPRYKALRTEWGDAAQLRMFGFLQSQAASSVRTPSSSPTTYFWPLQIAVPAVRPRA